MNIGIIGAGRWRGRQIRRCSGRLALPVAGDDEAAKATVLELIDALWNGGL
jgi:predicted dinucleotide-binding enzyme